ncbi:hypothetical protein [Sphingomicrobium arenosum]|uniref:hypothetical protein n=1 Tax=Sphingomicrobium arenosum TaxID=2233861 RepID=UPI002240ED67|nr:hypothetical protein [Sphingomicrobium arenosum]
MIALFRRLRSSAGEIRGPEWLLLGLETIAVVGGILLALALEDWVGARRDEAREQRLLDRLVGEMEESVFRLKRGDVFYRRVRAEARADFDAWINAGQCPQKFSIFTTIFEDIDLPTVAYDEMTATGSLSLLDDTRRRDTLANFHSELQSYNGRVQWFNISLPSLADDLAAAGYDAGFDAQAGWRRAYAVKAPDRCESPALKLKMAERMRAAEILHAQREELLLEAVMACMVVADSLGRACRPRGEALAPEDADKARDVLAETSP